MSYYRTCPSCGANLDPGEICDCQDKKELSGATNTEQLKAEQKSCEPLSSASSVPENKEESQV